MKRAKVTKYIYILLDYRLDGGMIGDSLARKIKEYNGTKIILISVYNLDDTLVKDLEENKYIAKYIAKPIRLTNLIELVADTISQTDKGSVNLTAHMLSVNSGSYDGFIKHG